MKVQISPMVLMACAWMSVANANCGGAARGGPTERVLQSGGPWYEVRFRAAALSSRRASGGPWHSSGGDHSASLVGGLLGLAIGYPEIGFALGSSMVSESQPEAPAPLVAVKIEGDTYRISPIGQTLAPRWSQPMAILSRRYRPNTPVLIQVLDAVDEGVLGQRAVTIKELLEVGARTLTNVGEVASLDLEVRAMAPRPPSSFELFVDGALSLEQLKGGQDHRWLPIPVWNGDRVTVQAVGEVCPSRPTPCFDADGAEPGHWQSYNYSMFAEARHAALVAILPDQSVAIGNRSSFVVEQAGFLLLFVNDSDESNNSGGFDVRVTVEPAR
jgi:hypothetical protein